MFEEVSRDLLFSKNDPQDMRLGELIKISNSVEQIEESSAVILGYPDDEGIQLNGGRVGASLAPNKIRQILYRMTPSLKKKSTHQIYDFGNLKKEATLLKRHEEARENLGKILNKKAKAVTLGGGHDYGFPDSAAFCDSVLSRGKRPFIVNFDAHLDVRSDVKGLNSGTPFFRLLKEFSGRVDFFEVGIQDWCNSKDHLRWAEEHGAQILSFDEILFCGKSFTEIFSQRVLSQVTRDHCLGLSLDIDCFKSPAAPGASQVFPVGLDPLDFLRTLRMMLGRPPDLQPQWLGVYEVSPPLDQDDQTSRLAALIIHQFLFS